MPTIHFLNVLEGDCNIIQHTSGRVTVIDVSNAFNDTDTPAEKALKASEERRLMRTRTNVPEGKVDYKQKLEPDNPISYMTDILGLKGIFRFIITHPDMDHLDGVKDFLTEFPPSVIWDTNNDKELDFTKGGGGYNPEDWDFYKDIRDNKPPNCRRYYAGTDLQYFNEDNINILCPTPEIVKTANETGNYNDLSYVLLFTCPKAGGGVWKILFAGDSDDTSWEYILKAFPEDIKEVDLLFAPHHGRDSGRSYDFLDILKPRVTLFGNASSQHLAYDCYPPTRITNNQAGFVVIDISEERMLFLVKHKDFAINYNKKKDWGEPVFYQKFKAWGLFQLAPKRK